MGSCFNKSTRINTVNNNYGPGKRIVVNLYAVGNAQSLDLWAQETEAKRLLELLSSDFKYTKTEDKVYIICKKVLTKADHTIETQMIIQEQSCSARRRSQKTMSLKLQDAKRLADAPEQRDTRKNHQDCNTK